MKDTLKHFEALSAQEILTEQPGKWDDYKLLDVLQHFAEERDDKRAAAITILILRSPEYTEMVAYDELYFDLVETERRLENYAEALRWAYAALAHEEQRNSGTNRANLYRELAETYLFAGDFNTGLAILTRCLKADPADIWIYNILGLTLPQVGLSELAVEVLDQALERVAEADPEGLKQQFENLHQKAVEKTANEPGLLQKVEPAILAGLRAAMQMTEAQSNGVNGYLPPVDQLMTAEGDKNEALYAEIIAQGKVLAPDLIRLAFDETLRDNPAPRRHAVALLRQLQAAKAVELAELKFWLDRAEGDWPVELLTGDAGKIGGFTTAELESIAADTEYDPSVRASMTSALVERAQKCPVQRERIVNFMRLLLTRPEASELAAEETFIGFLIGDIMDLEARELYPEVETAFLEDRVDTTIVDLAHVQQEWELPVTPPPKRREDGLYLPLQCKECRRVREYFVQHVIIDLGTQRKQAAGQPVKYDPHVMDREIICPKCGARDRYELTPQASLRLLIPTAGLESFAAIFRGEKGAKFKPHPRVHPFESVVFGRPMHPLAGLDQYRTLIAQKPADASLRMRMGNLLRTLHRYPQALESFRQGYELGTDEAEFVFARAMAEHDFGDREIAKALYEEAVELASKQLMRGSYMFDLIQEAQRGLKLLKRGKASPWEPGAMSRGQETSPQTAPTAGRKKGKSKSKRNKRKRKK